MAAGFFVCRNIFPICRFWLLRSQTCCMFTMVYHQRKGFLSDRVQE